MYLFDVFLNKLDLKKYMLQTAKTNMLNILLPTMSPKDRDALSKTTADTLVTNSGRLVIDAIRSPPIKAAPTLDCFDKTSP